MAKSMTRPEEIADTLGISGKVVRAYLRKTYKRPASAKGSTWTLDAKQTAATLKYFRARNPQNAKPVAKRTPKAKPVVTPAE